LILINLRIAIGLQVKGDKIDLSDG